MGILDYVVKAGEKPIDVPVEVEERDNGRRYRGWCFTVHDYTEDEVEVLKKIEVDYIVFGKEICPRTQRRHLQGYLYVHNKVTMKGIKKMTGIRRMHLESANGTAEQNRKYCTKDGDYVEQGVIPKQGKRSDIDTVKEELENGATMRDLLTKYALSYQAMRYAEMWLKYKEKPRENKTEVIWIYGPSGCGKSHLAFELAGEDYYVCNKDNRWWDGYDAHKCVIIDDMRGDFAKHHELLRIFDKWQIRSEVKGGYRQLKAERLIITTTKHPEEFFKNCDEDMTQVLRRINWIYHKKLRVCKKYKMETYEKDDSDGDAILAVRFVQQE